MNNEKMKISDKEIGDLVEEAYQITWEDISDWHVVQKLIPKLHVLRRIFQDRNE